MTTVKKVQIFRLQIPQGRMHFLQRGPIADVQEATVPDKAAETTTQVPGQEEDMEERKVLSPCRRTAPEKRPQPSQKPHGVGALLLVDRVGMTLTL